MMILIYLMVAMLASLGGEAQAQTSDEVTFSDFTLSIGDSIELGPYQAELVEIQSVRDGIAVMRVSQPGGRLDEQRAFLENSANSFEGGAEEGGLTITVIDIFDEQSAKVRFEYQKDLGSPRKQASVGPRAAPSAPNLVVRKSFDKTSINVGEDVRATITVKNTGTGEALEIKAEDQPPLPEFSYIAGYPPKIKEELDPGEADTAEYVMTAIKEGSVRVPAVVVTYADNKKNPKSNNSEPFIVIINPKSKPELEIRLQPSLPLRSGAKGSLNVSVANVGNAPANQVEIRGEIKPAEGLEASGLDKTFFEIKPGEEENYTAGLAGSRAGNYTVRLRVSYQGDDGDMFRESQVEVPVLEQEYKYLYYLLIVPVALAGLWMYRRHREYKY
jgi:uncharacterized repeat protein (TIGR01451 family)